MSEIPILVDDSDRDAVCRICHGPRTENSDNPLLSPCICSGSVQWVHRACLDQWRSQAAWPAQKACHCELCGSLYLYELQFQSQGASLIPVVRRSAIIAAVIVAFATFVAATQGLRQGFSSAGSLLGVWAISDIMVAAWTMLQGIILGSNVFDKALRKDWTMGGAAWQGALVALTRRSRSSGFARAIHQARAVTHTEAAVQVASQDQWATQAEIREIGIEGVDEELPDFNSSGGSPDGVAIVCFICSGCVTCCACLWLAPLIVWSLSRWLGRVFTDPRAVIVAEQMASGGAAYFIVVALVLSLVAACCPLPVVARGQDGMPIVRSLTVTERAQARHTL